MKTTKRALFSSVIALILCFSMLVGTTFAWFTDSVESGVNQIIAGNLDVELYNAIGIDENKKVDTKTMLFDGILWEPGLVAYENLTVANLGTQRFRQRFQHEQWPDQQADHRPGCEAAGYSAGGRDGLLRLRL